MFKSKILLEVKIGERLFELYMDSDSPLGTLYDALYQMRTEAVEQLKKAHEMEKPKEEQTKDKV